MHRIAAAGTGYVGLSLAALLAEKNEVTAVDVVPERVKQINRGKSPIADAEIEAALQGGDLHLTATMDAESAYRDAEFVIVAVPTNYDPDKKYFDTSIVEEVIGQVLSVNDNAVIVIKSTIPVGFTRSMQEKFHCDRILFSPEFLREGRALYDNYYPSRIVVGVNTNGAASATVLAEAAVSCVCFWNIGKFYDRKAIFAKYLQYWIAAVPIPVIVLLVKCIPIHYVFRMCIAIPVSAVCYFALLWLMRNPYLAEGIKRVRGKES